MKRISEEISTTFLALLIIHVHLESTRALRVGVGIADITGPAAEVGMMGYAKSDQKTSGIHTRLYSRSFVFEDKSGKRAVFVSVDAGMVGHMVKHYVIKNLEAKLPGCYSHENVLISATHTHAGPAGFLQYLLFTISTGGFIEQTFDAMVKGITKSITKAHHNLVSAKIYLNEQELHETNINRSPTSYLENPFKERQRYGHNTDRNFVQLNILSAHTGKPLGVINWFAVHATSMDGTNTLISSDNKGMASLILEREFNGEETIIGKGPFVAAFASSNLGDVSPNIEGPRCVKSGLPCHNYTSTCPDISDVCMASGPGKDDFESCWIIGQRHYQAARRLLDSSRDDATELEDSVDFAHQWIDMSKQRVHLPSGKIGRTCPPALGYSFAAGTTDGPGPLDFIQGTKKSSPFWDTISHLLKKPSKLQTQCHYPKPILINSGEIHFPYDWSPSIVDTQLIKIGHLLIIGAPGEFTTMAGRRLKETVLKAAFSNDLVNAKVVLSGLSNVYTHYTTTYEEYQAQRYEAASTIYGPHTLRAYQEQYHYLTKMLLENRTIPTGPNPPNFYGKLMTLDPGVVLDMSPMPRTFGDCIEHPPKFVTPGTTVLAKFVSGHPRNNLMLDNTYLTIERKSSNDTWKIIATDSNWETKFEWVREPIAVSHVIITWQIPADQVSGTYRIRHFGYFKSLGSGKAKPYQGETHSFEIVSEEEFSNVISDRKIFNQDQREYFDPEHEKPTILSRIKSALNNLFKFTGK